MLTVSGWLAAIFSIAVFVAGQIARLEELVILGVMGILLPFSSIILVRIFCPGFTHQRQINADLVSAQEPIQVDLSFFLSRNRPWTLPLDGKDTITLTAPNGERDKHEIAFATDGTHVTYDFTPTQRGMLNFGPFSLVAIDPFSLARRKWNSKESFQLLVLPQIDEVKLPWLIQSSRTWSNSLCQPWQGNSIGDFHALKEYVMGDDFRHIHWKSSAKQGELLIRQNEHYWEVGISILLDNRVGIASASGFEKMVTAAASIMTACYQHNQPIWLDCLASEGDGMMIDNAGSYRKAMIWLAQVNQEPQPYIKTHTSGRLIALTGDLTMQPEEVDALLPVTAGMGQTNTMVVSFGEPATARGGSDAGGLSSLGPGADLLEIPAEHAFSEVWNLHHSGPAPQGAAPQPEAAMPDTSPEAAMQGADAHV